MGEYFLYANLDRREYFMIDALGGATKSAGVGRSLGARALGLLLLDRGGAPLPETRLGSWAGDRIAVAGDYAAPDPPGVQTRTQAQPDRNLYALAKETFRDLSSAAALLLLRHDGPEQLLDVAERDDHLFVLLAELAQTHRQDLLTRALTERFGATWRADYARRRKKTRIVVPPPD